MSVVNSLFVAMDDKKIEEIVQRVFAQAKRESASHSKYALAKHVSYKTELSSRTLERAYDRYINKEDKYGAPQADSVAFFCKYLGYESFEDYVKSSSKIIKSEPVKKKSKQDEEGPEIPWKGIVTLTVIIVVGILGFKFLPEVISKSETCMVWVNTHYEEASCSKKYNVDVEPLDKTKLLNFKKVEVSMATQFFSEETQKPLIWYTKSKNDEIEYFTAPGLHPITGKTLDEITPYIIQKYVPLHSSTEESFLNN